MLKIVIKKIIFMVYFRAMSMLLPTWQDCHELWLKKRRRQMREQQDALQNLPPGKPPPANVNKKEYFPEGG